MTPVSKLDGAPLSARRMAVTTINWNGWRHTLKCLTALRETEGVDWHLFIVDNASTDDSRERLTDLGEQVTTIWADKNGGWTGGSNIGVRHALAAGYDTILLLNNDAYVQPDTLRSFLAAHETVPEAILGGVLMTEDGLEEDLSGSRIDPATGIPKWLPLKDLGPSDGGLLRTASVTGGALLADRAVFEAVGPFDDRFYMYYDETDWCARARTLGRPTFVVENAIVRHVGAGSTGGPTSPLVNYFLTRNRLLFVERYGTLRQQLAVWRIVLGRIRMDAKEAGGGPWPLALFRLKDPEHRARLFGLRDYVLRQFGNCPDIIRTLQTSWRNQTQ